MLFGNSLVALALGASIAQAAPINFRRPIRIQQQVSRPRRAHHRGMPQGLMEAKVVVAADCEVDRNNNNNNAAEVDDEVNNAADDDNQNENDNEEDDNEEVVDEDEVDEEEVDEDVVEGAAGAAMYWITNEPDGNFIMSATIDEEGQLTFADALWAGGVGAHGATEDPEEPDPLFSQGAVKVGGEVVVAVNAGSNTIAMFNIDPQNPGQLTMAGGPVGTGGEFPVSATISKVNGNVCVLNAGEVNGVQCFTADPELGLKVISGSLRSLELNTVTPPVGPADTPSQVLFSEDGTQLFASVKGNPDAPGFIAAWEVAEDGSLSEEFERNTPSDGGALPFGMTFVDGAEGPAILSTDPAVGFVVYNFDGVTAQNDVSVAIDGQVAACWTDFSRVTGNYYITDIGTSLVTEVSVDSETLEAQIVNQYPQGEDHSTIDNAIANVGGRDFLYVMSPGTKTIEVLELVAPGETAVVQTFDIEAAAEEAGITVNTANLQGGNVFFSV